MKACRSPSSVENTAHRKRNKAGMLNIQFHAVQHARTGGEDSYLFPQLMLMLSHGFLQLGDLCLLLLNNTSQVFDAVVVRQLIFGHLEPAGSGRASGSARGKTGFVLFVFSEQSAEKQTKVTNKPVASHQNRHSDTGQSGKLPF